MIPIMYLTTADEVARGAGPPFVDVLTWMAVPLVPIPFYAFLALPGVWSGFAGQLPGMGK